MRVEAKLVWEVLLYSFIGMLIYTLSLFIPIVIFLIPIPFILLYVKRNPLWGIVANSIACVLIFFASDILTASVLLIYSVFISHTLGFMLRQNFKMSAILVFSTIGSTAFVLLLGFLIQSFNDLNLLEGLKSTLQEFSTRQIDILQQAPLSSADFNMASAILKKTVEYAMVLLPSIILILSFLLSYINYYISATILRKMGIGIIEKPLISRFRLPKHVLFGIVSIVIVIYIFKIANFGFVEELILNVYLLFTFLFMINGIAAMDYILQNKVNVFVRIFLPFVLLFFFGLGMIYSLVGLLDLLFNFRDRLRRAK